MDCFAALAMTRMVRRHTMRSSSAKAGDPVRRGFSVLSLTSLEYCIVRRSLSSGGHSADPVANDDNVICFCILATYCARGLQVNFTPSIVRGRGECRMRAAPAVSCAMCTESARMSIQGSGGNPTFPAQWLYGLLRDLPGDRLSCHHHRRDLTRQLDASTEASGPHVFAVRFSTVRRGHFRVHRNPPNVVTLANAPLSRTGWQQICHCFALREKRNIFN